MYNDDKAFGRDFMQPAKSNSYRVIAHVNTQIIDVESHRVQSVDNDEPIKQILSD